MTDIVKDLRTCSDVDFYSSGTYALVLDAADEITRLREANTKLVGAIDMIRETLRGGNVEDLLYIINKALASYRNTGPTEELDKLL